MAHAATRRRTHLSMSLRVDLVCPTLAESNCSAWPLFPYLKHLSILCSAYLYHELHPSRTQSCERQCQRTNKAVVGLGSRLEYGRQFRADGCSFQTETCTWTTLLSDHHQQHLKAPCARRETRGRGRRMVAEITSSVHCQTRPSCLLN